MTPARLPAAILIALLLPALLLLSPTPLSAQGGGILAGETDTDLAVKFMRLSTSTEFLAERQDESKRQIRKWQRDIRMLVLGNVHERHRALLAEHVADLRTLTGLEIEITNPDAQHMPVGELGRNVDMNLASDLTREFPLTLMWNHRPGEGLAWRGNFIVGFGNREELLQLAADLQLRSEVLGRAQADSTTCYGSMFYAVDSLEIVFAAALIRNDLEDWKVRKCLVEETTQGFGLPGDAKGASWTLFNDTVRWRQSELTAYDRLFLRVLYDPRMRRGMGKVEAGRVAIRLIGEYRDAPETR